MEHRNNGAPGHQPEQDPRTPVAGRFWLWAKRIMKSALGILVLLVVLLWGNKVYRDAHYFNNYDPLAPLNVTMLETTQVNRDPPETSYTITRFVFDGYQGEKIPTLMTMPIEAPHKKLPAIIFLHGIGQNKNFLKEITAPYNQVGFAVACFDQYTQGERKLPGAKSFWARSKALAKRAAKTVNETRRLIDYLSSRPDIDPERIYLVGASYGAVTGSIVLAKDKRLRAGVMVYGGGDFRKLLNSYANHLGIAVALGLIDGKNLNPEKPPLPILTASQERKVGMVMTCLIPVARYFLGVADPIYYVGKISPTPVYFQNGKHDVLVPASAGKALQEAAREPKKITWYESDHVGIDREQTKRVLEDGLKWLLDQDNPLRPPEERVIKIPPVQIKKT
jgi:dienelactone hydrolase